MSYINKTERNQEKSPKKLILKKYNSSSNKNKIFNKSSPSRKKTTPLSKVILKGKLFSLINKSNIMTEDQFNDIKIRLTLAQLEKYKIAKKNIKKKFYYAQKNPNIIHPNKNPNKFEDDYINMRELLKKFSQKEQDEILSFPQFFQLNSNEFLKELVEEKHKNLYEIICDEEDKEIELKNLKQKQKEDLNNYKNNYNKTYHSRRSRKILLKNMDSEDISSNINSNINNSNDSFKTKKSKKIVMNFKKSFFSRNISEFPSGNKIVFKTDNNINSLKNKKNVFFQGNIWNKSKLSNKEMEKRINEKYEKLKKRKEWMILNKEKKLEEIKQKNQLEQIKKEKERKKMYQEKKFIDYISAKLKNNYAIKEEIKRPPPILKKDKVDFDIISSIYSVDSARKINNL